MISVPSLAGSTAVSSNAWALQGQNLGSGRLVEHDNLLGGTPSSVGFVALLSAFRTSGGTAPSAEVARLLKERPGSGSMNFLSLLASGEAFCFVWRGLHWVPMFQFNSLDLSLTESSKQVRDELSPELDAWGVAAWFARQNSALHGMRPVDLIGKNLPLVLQAARHDRDAMLPSQATLF